MEIHILYGLVAYPENMNINITTGSPVVGGGGDGGMVTIQVSVLCETVENSLQIVLSNGRNDQIVNVPNHTIVIIPFPLSL